MGLHGSCPSLWRTRGRKHASHSLLYTACHSTRVVATSTPSQLTKAQTAGGWGSNFMIEEYPTRDRTQHLISSDCSLCSSCKATCQAHEYCRAREYLHSCRPLDPLGGLNPPHLPCTAHSYSHFRHEDAYTMNDPYLLAPCALGILISSRIRMSPVCTKPLVRVRHMHMLHVPTCRPRFCTATRPHRITFPPHMSKGAFMSQRSGYHAPALRLRLRSIRSNATGGISSWRIGLGALTPQGGPADHFLQAAHTARA